jgi:cytochrome c oxidase subunit III
VSSLPAAVSAGRHHAPPLGRDVNWWGLALFIVSEAWIFLNLLAAYVYLRWLNPSGPPMVVPPRELLVPTVNKVILLASGVVAHWGSGGLARNARGRLQAGLAGTIALGTIFLAGQAYEYTHAAFTPQSSAYGASFYTLTGLHGLHVLVGMGFLLVLLLRVRRGAFSPARGFGVAAGTLYWHFVDAVWVALFTLLYLL